MNESSSLAPCSTPEARQFDFWVGEWNLTWGQDGKGTNSVKSIFDGCVIQENFDGRPSIDLLGMSISLYDARKEMWKQTWMDNGGGYFDLFGKFEDGKMTLVCEKNFEGKPILLRMVFHDIKENEFVWDWERSDDNGETWEMRWQIFYQRK